MDEPLASLDMGRKAEILPLIERLRDEFAIPIVYVSHAVEEVARLASKVVVLDAGRVAAVGSLRGTGSSLRHGRHGQIRDRLGPRCHRRRYDGIYGLTSLRHPAGDIYLAGPVGQSAGP